VNALCTPLALPRHDRTSRAGADRRARMLLVDDDFTIQTMLADYFDMHDIDVVPAFDTQGAMQQFVAAKPSVIILDFRHGREEGLELLRRIRSHSEVPIIVTAGNRWDEVDRAITLELGADDYVAKPFGLKELLSRVRAALWCREALDRAYQRNSGREQYQFGGWLLDRSTWRLTNPGGGAVELGKGEHALLKAFLDVPQRILSRDYLVQAMRAHDEAFDRGIEGLILKLRRKLEADPSMPRIIRTERGAGYVFDLAVEQADIFDLARRQA